MRRKGCGPYNLGAPKSPAKQQYRTGPNYEKGDKDYVRPTQEERNILQDKSRLTNEERKVINRQATLKEKGQAWLLDRKSTAELDKNIRKSGITGTGDGRLDNLRKQAQKKQWLKDSATAVNNRFYAGPQTSQIKTGNTGRYRSEPYIDPITGALSFRGKKKKQ